MRADAMIPIYGAAGTDPLAAGGGLEVPGRDPVATTARAHELATVSPFPEPIPGAYESDTLTHRESGTFGAPFNGAGVERIDTDATAGIASAGDEDDVMREEWRRIGGGGKR